MAHTVAVFVVWAWGSIIADASSIVLRLIVKGGVGLLQSSNGPFGNVDCCVTGGGLPSNTKRPTSKDDCIGGCCVEGGGLFSNTKRPTSKDDCIGGCCVAGVVVYLSAPNSSISKDDGIGGCCVTGGGLLIVKH